MNQTSLTMLEQSFLWPAAFLMIDMEGVIRKHPENFKGHNCKLHRILPEIVFRYEKEPVPQILVSAQ